MATIPTKASKPFDYGFILYAALHAAGFLAVTLLMTWGVLVLFFFAIGGFSLDGMMHQLANLSSRYIVADPARTGQFKLVLGGVQLVVGAAIIFFRRHVLIPRERKSPEQGA